MESQRELSKKVVGPPYVNPSTGKPVGTGQPEDLQRARSNQISRKGDDAQNLKVGLYDIEAAVMYYFNSVIKPTVTVNGHSVAVPIVYADPEKWSSVQKQGFYRDKNGQRQVPVIVVRRDEISKKRLTSKVDANYPNNFYISSKKYSSRNQYSRFNLIKDRIPEESYIVSVVPDYVDLQYTCIIVTDLISQANPIIEAINFASDSYWGDENRFKFQALVDSFRTETSTDTGEDRTIRTTFTMKLHGYILPDVPNSDPYVNLKKYRKTRVNTTFTEKIVKG